MVGIYDTGTRKHAGNVDNETISETAAKWDRRRCILWTCLATQTTNPSWPWVKHSKSPIYAEMRLNRKSVKFQIDSVVTVNVLPHKYVNKDDIQASDVTLHMWNKITRAIIGKIQANGKPSYREELLCMV